MNRSGDAVAYVSRFYKLPPEDMLVVHDDLDIEPGRLKFVAGGGAGGHNGIKSIVNSIGTKQIPRLKIGIGRPENQMIPVDRYVLSRFTEKELRILDDVLQYASDGVETWINDGISMAMNRFNRR
jgi:PTH1 family peptidyl-tRNA hydrolase